MMIAIRVRNSLHDGSVIFCKTILSSQVGTVQCQKYEAQTTMHYISKIVLATNFQGLYWVVETTRNEFLLYH